MGPSALVLFLAHQDACITNVDGIQRPCVTKLDHVGATSSKTGFEWLRGGKIPGIDT